MRVPLGLAALVLLLSAPAGPAEAPPAPATHGPDVLPPLALGADLPPAEHACAAGPDDAAFRVLYVMPPATLDQTDHRLPLIRAGIAAANGIVLTNALLHGVDVRLKFFCDAEGEVDIALARTTTPPNVATFATIAGELRAQGYARANEKYWVVYEGLQFGCGGCVGEAEAHTDDRASADNRNNAGNMYAITYVGNYGPIKSPTATFTNVMLHEATHTMGAVQPGAPHATGGFHCNDGTDVMCYADGAPHSAYSAMACPRLLVTWVGPEMPYDCGGDDYFHPAPPAGSYLSAHWNVGSPSNRFIAWRSSA